MSSKLYSGRKLEYNQLMIMAWEEDKNEFWNLTCIWHSERQNFCFKFTYRLLQLRRLYKGKGNKTIRKISEKNWLFDHNLKLDYTEYLKPSKQTLAANSRNAIRQIFEPMAAVDRNDFKSEIHLNEFPFLYILTT